MEKDKRTALYEIRYEGELMYVGISDNPKSRHSSHSVACTFPEGSVMTVVKWYETRVEAAAEERRRIASYKPPFNVMHNDSGPYCASDRAPSWKSTRTKNF